MKRVVIAAAVIAVVTAACGGGGEDNPAIESPGNVAKTVNIDMVDIAFEPKTLTVQRGERVEFVFQNRGAIAHDAFIGDAAAQADHEREMREAGGSSGGGHEMGGDDKDENAVTVDPGKTGRLTYTFDKPGTIEIGCHQPDHYAAGMKIVVTVT
jgi:uncharacterized cupredoxin-like copper-binding protein